MLTGKALNDFKTWIILKSDDPNVWVTDKISVPFEDLEESFQIALILEWFESEGIYIVPDLWTKEHWIFKIYRIDIFGHAKLSNTVSSYDGFESRLDATIEAIKKANEIYNKIK